MDRLRAIEVFVRVADLGGFAAAARALNISPPSATRAVAILEDRLGAPLFVRTTRSVRLTETGRRFLEDGRRILADLAEAEEAAVGAHAAPRGELRLTAPVLFGGMYVAPILADFLDAYPGVTAITLFLDRIVNLVDEGQDVAVRIGELTDSSLVARRVGAVRRTLFAAPSYLRAHGTPGHPSELTTHRLVEAGAFGGGASWEFRENGRSVAIRPTPPLRMNTNDAVREVVAAGWGISRLLSYQIAPQVGDGTLVEILTDFEPPPLPVHVIHREGRQVSARVRAFVDFMVDRLRTNPSINPPGSKMPREK